MYTSYPLSCLWNRKYPGFALLFSFLFQNFSYSTSCRNFKPHSRQQATTGLSSSSSLYWLAENVKEPMHFSQRVGTQIPVLWSGLVSKMSFQKMEKLLNAVWPKSSAKYCKALQSIFMHHYSNGNVIIPLGSGLGIPLLQDPLRKELK